MPYDKSGRGYCIAFLKRLDEGLRKQLSGQNPLILPGLSISIGWCPGLLVVNIIGNYCCTLVLLYAKMLKKLKMKQQDFFVTFLSLVAHSAGYVCDCNFNAICDIKILCAFLLVYPCVHDKVTLMVFW